MTSVRVNGGFCHCQLWHIHNKTHRCFKYYFILWKPNNSCFSVADKDVCCRKSIVSYLETQGPEQPLCCLHLICHFLLNRWLHLFRGNKIGAAEMASSFFCMLLSFFSPLHSDLVSIHQWIFRNINAETQKPTWDRKSEQFQLSHKTTKRHSFIFYMQLNSVLIVHCTTVEFPSPRTDAATLLLPKNGTRT